MGAKFEKLLVYQTSSRIEDTPYCIILEPSGVISGALCDGTHYFFRGGARESIGDSRTLKYVILEPQFLKIERYDHKNLNVTLLGCIIANYPVSCR